MMNINNNNDINNHQLIGDRANRSLNIIKIFSGAFTVVIGVMILAGYIFGNYFVFNLGKDYKPMADETALLFIIIGMVILLIDKSRNNRKLQYLIFASSIFVGLIGILTTIDFLTNYAYNLSEILGGYHYLTGNKFIGKMSLITAFTFIIYSISLILIIYKYEKISTIFSTLILFVGYIIIIGYWFGVPYLYGGSFIPVSLPTAIVMIISSLGMLIAAGYDSPPLKYFLGDSTQARLMRSFIPIIFFYNLVKDLLLMLGNENINSYFALRHSIVDILSLILTSFIISLVSRSIGKSIDNNIAERKVAEEEMRNSRDSMVKLNIELETSRQTALNIMKDTVEAMNALEITNIEMEQEISERNLVEKALRESEQLLRESQAIARLGSFVWDISTGLWKSSEILDELFGIDENYVRSLEGWSSIVHPDWQKIMTEYVINEVIGKLQKFDKEYQIIRQNDGKERWVHGLAVLELDSNNQPIRLIGTISDITERKLAEEALRESEEKYRNIFENAQEGIFQTNINGTIISVNPALAKMFGFDSPEELIKTRLDISKDSYYDPMERDKFLRMIEKDGFVEGYEYEVKHKDGTKLWFYEDSRAVKDDSGRIQYFEGFVIDITERKRFEKDLIRSEKELIKAQQISHLGSWSLNLETNKVVWTEELYRMYGFDSTLPPPPYTEHMKLFTPESWEMLSSSLAKTRETGIPYELELKTVRKDGSNGWMWVRGETELNNDGITVGLWGTAQDITVRKRFEKDLIIANEALVKLKKAIYNSEEAVFLTDLEGIFTFVNPAFTSLYGFSSDEVVGKTTPRILKSGVLDKSVYDYFWQTLLNGDAVKGELINKRKDGTLVTIEGSSTPIINEEKNIIGFLGIQHDITERKQAEQELIIAKERAEESETFLTNIFENIPNMVFVKNADDLRFIRINKAGEELMGYTSEELIGKNDYDFFPKEEADFFTSKDREVFKTDEQLIIEVESISTKFGIKKLYTKKISLKNKKGNYQYLLGISEDITKKIEIERELKKAKERAEESDNLKTAFLQNMSHEIRTPLSGIIGFSRMLNSENLSKEDIQEFTNMITVSSERLTEIVNNVLEMSKIQTGQVKVVLEPILINMLFSDLFVFFSHIAEAKNIGLNYHNIDDTERTIYSDEGKLIQIFSNLINNSIKFTNSGQIDYGFEIIDNYVQFYVKDTGVGIPEEQHEKIFDRFTQAEQSISRSYEGAGLGLAICKGLVEMLGGSIRVESEINKGTAFYFTLPCNEEFVQTQEDKENPENSVKYVKGKILIVEDDWVSSQYLIRFFEDANITVIHAGNGEQAVELVRNTPDIDLIVMDIKMPVMNGFEAAKLIKNMRPDLAIIAQTAYAFVEEKQKILSAGFDDYISKPYDTKKLMTFIDKNLKIN